MVGANQHASLLYSKIAAGAGTLILSGDALGIPEAQWTKAIGIVLAAAGFSAILLWKMISWGAGLLFARVDVINGLPEALAKYEQRAIQRDQQWKSTLEQWELRFNSTDAKLNASMALQSAIVTGLTNRIDATAAGQTRTEERLDALEQYVREHLREARA